MDGEGDGADDDDDDDDDLDDARCNDGDCGDDFPLREGISPVESPTRKVFLLSVGSIAKRRWNKSTNCFSNNFRSWGVSTLKGCRRRGQGPPGAHQAWPRGGPRMGVTWLPLGSPLVALRAPPVISDETPFSDFCQFF